MDEREKEKREEWRVKGEGGKKKGKAGKRRGVRLWKYRGEECM